MTTIILTDSCCDLTQEYLDNHTEYLDVIGMPVNVDGHEYYDDFGKTLPFQEFYNSLRSGVTPSTSQINAYRFRELFLYHHKQGRAILYIGFSSGMSGTYNNSVLAKKSLLEEYPEANILTIDTASASVGQGVLVMEAVEMLKQGKTAQNIWQWIEDIKYAVHHWFAVDDLHYLKKGGRISALSATVGSALHVKPILSIDREGKLKSFASVRGRKKSIKFLFERFKENYLPDQTGVVLIGHGDALEDALALQRYVLAEFAPKEVVISQLSATIASHVGPNMIAIAFVGTPRGD